MLYFELQCDLHVLLEMNELKNTFWETKVLTLPMILHVQRPLYQPSGESDKENKRLGAPQSPSSSDRSLSGQPPLPLST